MATPPQTVRGARKTYRGRTSKKLGRPTGTKKKRLFEETKLGFFLKYRAPIEYDLIMKSTKNMVYPEPSVKVIKLVAFASPNPVFKKNMFYRYLEEYEEKKLTIRKPKRLTEANRAFYERLAEKQMREYIEKRKKNDVFFA